MIRSTTEKIKKRIQWYAKLKEPYLIEISNHRLALKGEGSVFMNADALMKTEELHVIKKVKADIVKQELFKKIPSALKRAANVKKNILYYQYSDKIQPGYIVGDCVEIDLTMAYWETAYKLGLINKDVYEKAESMSKITRLAAIGSLAKRKLIRAFDGEKEYTILDKKSELYYIWNVICYKVGKIMEEAEREAGKDFVFFWVDAVFVKKQAMNKVIKVFKKHGYKWKTYKVDSIQVSDRHLTVKSSEKTTSVTKDGITTITDTRPFPLSKKHKNFSS